MGNPVAILVNLKDEIIGYKKRSDLKRPDMIRVSTLWIENSKGEILLAQRAFDKKTNPGKWAPAVSGTNEKGETYESNIIKEAEEEIGIKNFKMKKIFKKMPNEEKPYFSQWFYTVVDKHISEFKKQDEEVEAIKWWKKEEIIEFCKNHPDKIIGTSESWIDTIEQIKKWVK